MPHDPRRDLFDPMSPMQDPSPSEKVVPGMDANSDQVNDVVASRELQLTRIDASPALNAVNQELVPDRSTNQVQRAERERRNDPITQSLMLLATLAVMLVSARYVVPRVVEEIRYAWHRGELRAEYETGNEGLRNVSLDALSQAYQMVTSAVGPS
ncbi:MAG: hypothetical protein P8L85_16045, partial [Rubripirellula sp.]|nr:hypothetical protein [Rubripirellula sp.]